MEAEQYTPDAGTKRFGNSRHPLLPGTPVSAIVGILQERRIDTNAQFIRPFDLGLHTFEQIQWIVNCTKHWEK